MAKAEFFLLLPLTNIYLLKEAFFMTTRNPDIISYQYQPNRNNIDL